MNHSLMTCRRTLVVVLTGLAMVGIGTAWPVHRAALGDELAGPLPMPPLPEEVRVGAAVQPVSLEVAAPLPLDSSSNAGTTLATGRSTSTGPVGNWTVLAAIASAFVVLAGFRFWQTRSTKRDLPSDVFEILGEAALGSQHAVRVVRFGPRTLLVGTSNAGCQTLATLDDPQVTERIVTACTGSRLPRPNRVPVRSPPPAGSHGGREAR